MPVTTRQGAQGEKGKKGEKHVVTGGGGFAGFSLARKLAEMGHSVVLLDLKEPVWPLKSGMHFVQGDIRNYEDVRNAVQGADVVFHMASYGMSGREQLNKALIEQVNVGGTENVLRACLESNVCRLVYTSTYNVVFGGKEIVNGDETLPYLTDDQFTDHYSKTKTVAERKALAASGQSTENGSTLRCCALRLAGVYGPGELRHLPRIVSYLEQGLVVMTYGSRDSLVDFLHVDNLVQGHVLAARGLSSEKDYVAAGQSYFLSDAKPVNNFEFFRPLIEGLGYTYPKINLPLTLVFYFAFLTEVVHSVVGKVYNFQPLLTRTEVYKTGVTHYFSTEKARRDLGFVPSVQNDLSGVVKHYRTTGHMRGAGSSTSSLYWLVNVLLALAFAALIMSFLPSAK
ncbi:short-chain dehydrogenase/reductase family 42E member 1-like [Babylonia areolata]|uniref:short-chain dehydrogenase/reductase family 42E member 1-like n=1 Tax=Babylonia areolata TaxID=304850 RepID=UPI003FD679FE